MITQPKKIRPSRPGAPGECPCGAQGYSSPWEGDFLLCMEHARAWLGSEEKIRAMQAIGKEDDEGLLLAIDSFCDRIRVKGYTRELSDALWGFPPRDNEAAPVSPPPECVCMRDPEAFKRHGHFSGCVEHHASGEGKCDCHHAPCRHDAFRFMRERDELARAIGEASIAAGIVKPGTYLTGPQLLMLCSDLAFTASGAMRRPTIVDHVRAIFAALGLVKGKK